MRTMYLLARPVLMSLNVALLGVEVGIVFDMVMIQCCRLLRISVQMYDTPAYIGCFGSRWHICCLVTGPYRQSLVAISLDAFLGGIVTGAHRRERRLDDSQQWGDRPASFSASDGLVTYGKWSWRFGELGVWI
ncbi:hypothetical protein KCU87_g317, partial [Aureobasidium melanogenum]